MKELRHFSQALVQNSVDLLCVVDKEGHFVSCNSIWSQKLGYSLDELSMTPFLQYVHPDDTQGTLDEFAKLKQGQNTFHFQNRYITREGNILWLDWRAHYDEKDELTYASANDITELKNKEDLLSFTQKTAVIGSWKFDIQKEELWWSDVTYKIHELDPNKPVVVDRAIDYYAPQHRPVIRKAFEDCLNHHAPWDMELQILTEAGRTVWVRAIGRPVVVKGSLVRLEGVFQDIDSRKRAEIQLQEKYEEILKYEIALNEHSIVARTDDKGRIHNVNNKFCEISKYSKEELIGQDHRIINSGVHGPEFFKKLWKTISLGQKWRGEICNKAKDGSLYWVDTSITPIADTTTGQIKEYIAIRNDITARKLAEMNLETERMKNLHGSKLAALGEMAAGIAHEVNNPLTTILLGARSVQAKLKAGMIDESQVSPIVDKILKSVDRASRIVKSLKTFARDGSKDPFRMVATEQLCNEVANISRERFAKKNIELKIQTEPGLHVWGREVELLQVIINLLNNAFDAVLPLENRWVRLAIGKNKGKIEIAVEDSGSPLQDETLKKMFQPFFTTKDVGKGTGLGLSIATGIIKDHDGQLVYDDKAPHVRFIISLPKAQTLAPSEKEAA